MFRHLFGVEIYGVVQAAALVLFCALAVAVFRRARIRLRHVAGLTLLYILCNFLVAKLLFDYVKDGGRHTLFQHPSLSHFLEGGYWGWPIAFFPCALIYPFAARLPPVPFYRAMAFLLPPVFAVQKIACFLAGCCFGRETTLPWAVVFPEESLCATPGVPVHPLQIYDALLPLVILGILVVVDRRNGPAIRPFLLPLMIGLYALARFITEFFRPREQDEVLLLSQWLELGTVLVLIVMLALGRRLWLRLVESGPALKRPAMAGSAG